MTPPQVDPVTGASAAPATGPDAPDAPSAPQSVGLDWLTVAFLTVLTVAVALFEVLFLPLYAGSVPVPVSCLIGAAWLWWAVPACHRLTRSMPAAFAPAVGWLIATLYLGTYSTLGFGLVIGDWRATLMLGLGSLAAAVSLARCWGRQVASPDGPRNVVGVTPPPAA